MPLVDSAGWQGVQIVLNKAPGDQTDLEFDAGNVEDDRVKDLELDSQQVVGQCRVVAKFLEGETFTVLSSRGTDAKGLELIEKLTEESILAGKTLVSGHDTPEYQRSSIVPLRWGAPRVIVLDCGLFKALGDDLKEEPFRAARLWRYQFDPKTDLAVSCLNPDSDYHPNSNKIRDRLIASLSLNLDFVNIRVGGNMEALAKSSLRAGRIVRIPDYLETEVKLKQLGAALIPTSY